MLDYRPTSLQEAAAAVERIEGFMANAMQVLAAARRRVVAARAVPEAFEAAMDDDLNVPPPWPCCTRPSARGNTALAAGDRGTGGPGRHCSKSGPCGRLGINPMDPQWTGDGGDDGAHTALGVLVEAQLEARARARADKGLGGLGRHPGYAGRRRRRRRGRPDGASWSLKRG